MLCQNCGAPLKNSEDELFHNMFGRCHHCTDDWSRVLIDASEDRKAKDIAVKGERMIGFEVESNPTFESAVKIFASTLANFKHDGSLRGSNPIEFVSPILSYSTYEEYCDKFFGLLDVTEWYSRQSTHVHIDTSDLNWLEFNLMAAKATANWRLFAAMCPPSRFPLARDRNDGGPRLNTLVPIFRNKLEFLFWLYGRKDLRAKKHSNMSIMRASKRCNDGDMRNGYPGGRIYRYDWLNLHGHFHKGATEWRIFASTKSSEKMKNWISFLIQFTEAVKHMKPNDYIAAPISSMISADVWHWVLNRIATLKPLHEKFGSIDPALYTGRKDIPISGEKRPKLIKVDIPDDAVNADTNINRLADYDNLVNWLVYLNRINLVANPFDAQPAPATPPRRARTVRTNLMDPFDPAPDPQPPPPPDLRVATDVHNVLRREPAPDEADINPLAAHFGWGDIVAENTTRIRRVVEEA